ncbi:glycine/D-amino acid oxidase-like deaminating enzyme [Agromyces flavus]|uniref:Glycine/D-amino acid oxidase n=1 Tax=Agromyces flavus TaxID=589382 RepID=A0A1H1XB66_9MICO|nr:FAD-dependent oxidoreductase [Agromyces flavus]MCP2366361.1 glycine/D-amino acid oxidase-like deaminating enzyme [Agromyces flavus]GGI44522.1 oxidoreductase [Agromyces flavus]SDT05859.1 Glycine/D-amino acid oxidase [Agromyces flavus]
MGTTVYERRRPAASVIERSLADTQQSVFWLDDLPGEAKRTRPRLEGSRVVDLAIVGGGYTGLWTAVLAKRADPDRRVVLLEARQVGWAASGRNGGFCEASLTHGRDNGLSRWPAEIDELDRLGLANLDAIEASEADFGMDFEFERNGALDVAVEPHQVEWLHEAAAEAASRGDGSVRLLDEHQVRAEVNSPVYLGAVWNTRTSAILHPAKLAAELARVAEEAGVEIFERSPVTRLDTPGSTSPVRLSTEHGRVDATRAVLATNVFPSLLKRNRLMTVPVYDYVLMTEPLSSEQRASIGWANRQGVGDLANQFHYSRMTRDGRILFGGYDAIYHAGARIREQYERRPESFAKLASHFFTTYPQLEGLRFTHRWAGAIDTSTQFTAFTGLARDGRVAYASGFTGLGVASTRFMAETMLDLLAGRETERTALEMVRTRPLPFPPEPAASVGINLTRWSLDRADHRQGRRNLLLRTLDAVGLGFDS